jgi:hypothetical protein
VHCCNRGGWAHRCLLAILLLLLLLLDLQQLDIQRAAVKVNACNAELYSAS